MIRQCPPWYKHMLGYFKACWVFFTPCLLLVSTEHPPGAGGRGEKSSPPSISLPSERGSSCHGFGARLPGPGAPRGLSVAAGGSSEHPWGSLWLPAWPRPWGQAVPWRHVACARSALQSVLICACLDMQRVSLHNGMYEYAIWDTNLGICMVVLTCLPVTLWAVVVLCRQSGTLRNVSVRGGMGHRDGVGADQGLPRCWGWGRRGW